VRVNRPSPPEALPAPLFTYSVCRHPDAIDDETAAAVMLQGISASHFATQFYAVKPGDIALVHAAAGGVGGSL
jgi:NADPH:quinone reductase-like Zn-dependent oxidoreductase